MIKKAILLSGVFFSLSVTLPIISNTDFAYSEIQLKSENKPLYEMTVSEIEQLLSSLKGKTFQERLETISERAKGTPYFLGPLGEGPDSPFDKKPLIDLTRFDCVTFCEHMLAFALSSNYDDAFNTLQKIRYRNGEIRIQKRNHYFMSDWVVNNNWLVEDVTSSVGAGFTQPVTKTISHKNLFASWEYKNLKAEEPDRTMTINYIPKDKLFFITPKLKSGDIAVFIQNIPGIFASHTGLIFKEKSGNFVFRNATSRDPKQVTDMDFNTLIKYLLTSKKNLGLAIIRPKQNL